MLAAGKLDCFIAVQRQAKTITPSGGTLTVWTDVANTRAEIVQHSTDELSTGFGAADSNAVTFRIRWRDDITTADRIIFDGRAHDIKKLIEIGRRVGLQIICEDRNG